MALDFSRCRLTPFRHQIEDTERLVKSPYFFVTSEMRTGKSKIICDGAQFLHESGDITRVVVVCPAPVRDVWFDEEFGEIAKHLFPSKAVMVTDYHTRKRQWFRGQGEMLKWVVSNYEFLRSRDRLEGLLAVCDKHTLLVGDESSYLKNHAAAQTKAFAQLRQRCGRVVLMNGTPIHHSPLDLFSQGNILSPTILDCKFITRFKARYATQEVVRGYGGKPLTSKWGKPVMKINGWTNLEDLQQRFAHCTVRRLQKDCLDLPPKLDPVTLTATLSKETWKAYKDMRDELVVWLGRDDVATAGSAAIRVLRLSQITSGFLGGIEDAMVGEDPPEEGLIESLKLRGGDVYVPERMHMRNVDSLSNSPSGYVKAGEQHPATNTAREVGREKLDVLLWFLETHLEQDPNLKVVVWHRFRPEAERTARVVKEKFPLMENALLVGGQHRDDRRRALGLLHPDTAPDGPVLVSGTAGTGSFGLNFTAAHTCVTMSCGYSPGQAAQMLDRVYGPGQTAPVAYYDILAVGPSGQKTIDHAILSARRAGEDVATWTSGAWVKAMQEE